MIDPLDDDGCRRLADAIGDTPTWSIMIHALLTGRGRAYVVGEIDHFDAALGLAHERLDAGAVRHRHDDGPAVGAHALRRPARARRR